MFALAVAQTLAVIGSVAPLLLMVVPTVRVAMGSRTESGSRGDRIFEEARHIKHNDLGFMHRVKGELQQLASAAPNEPGGTRARCVCRLPTERPACGRPCAQFDFVREYERRTGIRLVIVVFIDDLDRCAQGGRNVKVLEAMQLMLSIPGAPLLVFLAIDSRVVVASIEESFGTVMQNSHINGW